MNIKAQKQAVLDNQEVDRDLLLESIAMLPDQVIKNVETISQHEGRHQKNTSANWRTLANITTAFRHPQFLYFQIGFFTIWQIYSHLANQNTVPKVFPPLDLRDQWLSIAGLLISTSVLIYQTRQEELSEERSHLMLQLNLLTEQKIAKLISLVEELRVDLPDVIDRDDLEAEIMKQATDPGAILGALQQNMEHLANLTTASPESSEHPETDPK
jgi:uncharacterized membrane protein